MCIFERKKDGTEQPGKQSDKHLTVPAEGQSIVSLPGRACRCVVVTVSLAQPTVLLSDRGETTSLAALVDWVADPVDTGVTADL